jgi:ribosomal protein S18 acetylase RimI-like enzyme
MGMTEIEVRPFEAGDEAAVVVLWEACGLVVPWNDPHQDIATKLAFQPGLFLVAQRGETLVGAVMAGYEGHRGWINYLAVAPELQGTGLGRLIMEEAERRLRELGCPKINLQVRGSNQKVIAFYQALGYRIDDVVSLGKRLDGR